MSGTTNRPLRGRLLCAKLRNALSFVRSAEGTPRMPGAERDHLPCVLRHEAPRRDQVSGRLRLSRVRARASGRGGAPPPGTRCRAAAADHPPFDGAAVSIVLPVPHHHRAFHAARLLAAGGCRRRRCRGRTGIDA